MTLLNHRRDAGTPTPGSKWRVGLAALGILLGSVLTTGSSLAENRPDPEWSAADIPSQEGRIFVVTGGTSGMGYEGAKALAAAGAQVIIAARNPQRGQETIQRIQEEVPGAQVRFEAFDLADLASVRALGERLNATLPRLDGLINNAGVMTPPTRQVTGDGLELQFGVNYLGHFALTCRLLPLLRRSDAPRVVTLSSVAARAGQIDLEDLQSERLYRPMKAYGQSKLACLMFALELQRRSDEAGWGIRSVAAHPGVSRTDLLLNAPGRSSWQGLARSYLWFLFQPVAKGALPTLYAATSAYTRPGTYYGPNGMGELRGLPSEAKIPPQALDTNVARRLWDISEDLADLRYAEAPHYADNALMVA